MEGFGYPCYDTLLKILIDKDCHVCCWWRSDESLVHGAHAQRRLSSNQDRNIKVARRAITGSAQPPVKTGRRPSSGATASPGGRLHAG